MKPAAATQQLKWSMPSDRREWTEMSGGQPMQATYEGCGAQAVHCDLVHRSMQGDNGELLLAELTQIGAVLHLSITDC